MTDRPISRRDWMTGVASTLAATGISACGKPPSPAGALPSSSPFAGRPRADHPNIIIFLSDTLRADHLSCYGRKPQTSRTVDGLAQDGVLFERFSSGSTWTKPSIGSMFTGVPALVHQAVATSTKVTLTGAYRVQILREEFLTLAEALKKLGYTTGSFVGNGNGRPEFGYGRGFDHAKFKPGYDVSRQVPDAIDWIRNKASEPFFLVIHQLDPHGPYLPSDNDFFRLHHMTKEDARGLVESEDAEIIRRHLEGYHHPEGRAALARISPTANHYLEMLYDAEIYSVDDHFRRLVSYLKRIDVFDHTVVTFTSDHGEAFREHGLYGHVKDSFAYNELVHIPLVMGGGGLPQGVRIPHSVSMIDLYPTLLELAGGTPPDYVTGKPMLSQSGEVLVDENRLAYTDLDYRVADLNVWDACVFDGQYKVASYREMNQHRIFDCLADPGELKNLSGSGELPEEKERMLIATLNAEVDRYDKLRQQFGEPVWSEAADGVQEELEALGYL